MTEPRTTQPRFQTLRTDAAVVLSVSRELPPARMACTRRSCVPQLVAAAAEASPEAIALSFGGRQLTYAELDARASHLGAYLRSLGAGPEAPVAICLERSFDYVIAALAAWKAGAAYLPLDPSWPAERRAFVAKDAQAQVLINRSGGAAGARFTVDLDADAGKIARTRLPDDPAIHPVETRREDLAYIIYTSGSTGQPKGVEVTHGNLLNLVFWHRRTFGVTSADRASHLAGVAFDAAVWELWPYLTCGARIALADDLTRMSSELLRQWICAQDITVAFVPTTLAEPMLAAEWPRKTKLRYLFTGADTLHHRPSSSLPFPVVNNYGPTECTVVATSAIVPAGLQSGGLPPIGRPIAHTEIYLLDEQRQPVAAGETGEIYIGGTGVARGYRNRPDLTAQRFLPNPFSRAAGACMYRTGDLGCLLPGGQIAFRGRADSQEKIRGHRVEPDEIASVLAEHPAVSSCAVAAKGAPKRKGGGAHPQGHEELFRAASRLARDSQGPAQGRLGHLSREDFASTPPSEVPLCGRDSQGPAQGRLGHLFREDFASTPPSEAPLCGRDSQGPAQSRLGHLSREDFASTPPSEVPLCGRDSLGPAQGRLGHLSREDFASAPPSEAPLCGRGSQGPAQRRLGHLSREDFASAPPSEAPLCGRGSQETDRRLIAYIVAKKGMAPSASELREFLSARLPEYMVPSAFVCLDALPLNANGKLDREALPEPSPQNQPAAGVLRAPQSPVEIRIAGILADLLHVERVGLDDNFFLLGGHSLLGAQLILRLRERFGVDLTLRHLFEAQTLAKLALLIESLCAAKIESMSEDEATRLLEEMENA
jgi:amino acid adenylation domain-containing protein